MTMRYTVRRSANRTVYVIEDLHNDESLARFTYANDAYEVAEIWNKRHEDTRK